MRARTLRPSLPRFGFLLTGVLIAVAGCGSSEPSYYTLAAWPGPAGYGAPAAVVVRNPTVAPFLDRDYIVRDDKAYKLKLADDAAWAEPIAHLIGRTLTQDLQQRLPGSTVTGEDTAVSVVPQALVELDVQRFSTDGQGRAVVDATLSVQRPGAASAGASLGAFSGVSAGAAPGAGGPAGRLLHLSMTPAGPGTADLVAALSQLLGQVADEAARQARALGPLPPDPAAAVRG